MRHVAAYLLAVLGGNNSPSAQDVKTILASAGVDADESRLSALLKELEGKDISELIQNGAEKLAKFGGGGAAPVAAAGNEAPVEEAKKEEEEEEDADLGGGMDMFGGGDDY